MASTISVAREDIHFLKRQSGLNNQAARCQKAASKISAGAILPGSAFVLPGISGIDSFRRCESIVYLDPEISAAFQPWCAHEGEGFRWMGRARRSPPGWPRTFRRD